MTALPPSSSATPQPVIGHEACHAPRLDSDDASRGRMMAILGNARRIAGWSCIALGKIGSLLLLWAIVTGKNALFGWFGIAPLFAMTLAAVVIGLWILLRNERT